MTEDDHPGKPPCLYADLAKIKDPIARARTAEQFATYADGLARLARGIRNTAVREAAGARSQPQIAKETEINVHTVKAILR